MPVPPRETIKKFFDDQIEDVNSKYADTAGIKDTGYYEGMPLEFKEDLDYQLSLLESYIVVLQRQSDRIVD